MNILPFPIAELILAWSIGIITGIIIANVVEFHFDLRDRRRAAKRLPRV